MILLLAVPVLVFRAAEERSRQAEFTVAVQGDLDAVPGLRAALDRVPLDVPLVDDAARAVVAGSADTAVIVPPAAAGLAREGVPVRLQVLSLPTEASGRFGAEAVTRRSTRCGRPSQRRR